VIRGICFDLDGTLGAYTGDFPAFLGLLRAELMLQACDMNRFAVVMAGELRRDGALTLELALARALERLQQRVPTDLPALAAAAVRSYAEDVRPRPGAGALLERLNARGVPLALASNGPIDMQRAALRALGFERAFRAVLISGDADVAARKPAPRIFSLACVGLEAAPDRVLMVGDDFEADVRGALDFGMPAVWLRPEGHEDDGDATSAELEGAAVVRDAFELDALLTERFGL